MFKVSVRITSARVWLSPFLLFLLLLHLGLLGFSAPGYAENRNLTIAPGMTPQDAFPEIRERVTETLKAQEGAFKIQVHHAEGEKALAREAAEVLKRPVVFLRDLTGFSPGGMVEAYLYPLSGDQPVPKYQARGPGVFTGVFIVRPETPLLEVPENRIWYLETLPHELAHRFVHDLSLRDRWLDDGLSEYLKRLFVRAQEDLGPKPVLGEAITLAEWNPALVALDTVDWEEWDYRATKWVIRKHEKDAARAAQLIQEELWNYSAAVELLERWMAAARDAGVEEPVQDLVRRLRDHRGKVRWKDTRDLIRAQTGKSLRQLVQVSSGDLQTAREWAWSEHLSRYFAVRTRALRTLTFLGLPEGVDATSLLDAYELPEVRLQGPYVAHNLAGTVSAAIGRVGDPEVAAAAIAELRERFPEEDLPVVSDPGLWSLLAEAGGRDEALEGLVAMLQDPRQGLEQKRQANAALEKLTGTSAGWATDHSPQRRSEAAGRWAKILETLEDNP